MDFSSMKFSGGAVSSPRSKQFSRSRRYRSPDARLGGALNNTATKRSSMKTSSIGRSSFSRAKTSISLKEEGEKTPPGESSNLASWGLESSAMKRESRRHRSRSTAASGSGGGGGGTTSSRNSLSTSGPNRSGAMAASTSSSRRKSVKRCETNAVPFPKTDAGAVMPSAAATRDKKAHNEPASEPTAVHKKSTPGLLTQVEEERARLGNASVEVENEQPAMTRFQTTTAGMSMEPLPLFSHFAQRSKGDEIPNLPPKTGTGLPMVSTRPIHSDVPNPNRNEERFAEDNIGILTQRMRSCDNYRLAHPEELLNEIVYDSVGLPNSEGEQQQPATSSAGGTQPTARPFYTPNGPDDHTLVFESRFESGNLRRAMKVREFEYDLVCQPDINTNRHTQWFYFRVSNTMAGCQYKFNIVNMMKPDSSYNEGMKPIYYSDAEALISGAGWRRTGTDIVYYRNSLERAGKGSYFTLTFSVILPHDNDVVYFAHCYPYTYTDLQIYLHQLQCDPKRSRTMRRRALCKTLAQNPCDLLTITSFDSPEQIRARRGIVLSARVHPGETNASWMMKGVIDFLTSDTEAAKKLRQAFVFKVVPMLNPDGVINGNYRCSLAGVDLNRQWLDPSRTLHPTVYHLRETCLNMKEDRDVLMYCDFHGHSRMKNIFIYGCDNTNNPDLRLCEQVFPYILSKGSPRFSFQDCAFRVEKSKEATARIVIWRRAKITNSYTLESSFQGADFGPNSGFHFNQRDYEAMGHEFCEAILRYIDPVTNEALQAKIELERLSANEVVVHEPMHHDMVDSDVDEGEADYPELDAMPEDQSGCRDDKSSKKNDRSGAQKPKKKRSADRTFTSTSTNTASNDSKNEKPRKNSSGSGGASLKTSTNSATASSNSKQGSGKTNFGPGSLASAYVSAESGAGTSRGSKNKKKKILPAPEPTLTRTKTPRSKTPVHEREIREALFKTKQLSRPSSRPSSNPRSRSSSRPRPPTNRSKSRKASDTPSTGKTTKLNITSDVKTPSVPSSSKRNASAEKGGKKSGCTGSGHKLSLPSSGQLKSSVGGIKNTASHSKSKKGNVGNAKSKVEEPKRRPSNARKVSKLSKSRKKSATSDSISSSIARKPDKSDAAPAKKNRKNKRKKNRK